MSAHFGEALWMAGDRQRVRLIWQQGLDLKQADAVLRETLERFLSSEERAALAADA